MSWLIDSIVNPVAQGISNIFSGGNWRQSGGELAAQEYQENAAASASAFSAQQAELARQFNADEAQKQRDFEERLSNTAYERAYNQLRGLGINPYAMLSGMSASSTPSGSAASGSGGSAYMASTVPVHGTGNLGSKDTDRKFELAKSALNLAGKLVD